MSTTEVYRVEIPIETRDNYKAGFDRANREVSRFERAIRRTNQKLDRLTGGRWSITLGAIDRASRVIRSVSRFAASSLNRTFNITVRAIDLATRPIRGIARMATSTLGMLGLAGGIAGGIVIPLKMTADRQNMVTAFEVLLGSAEAANKRIEELITFAGQTPFTRDSIFEASRILEVFTKGALSTGDGLKMVGDIAAGTQQEFTDVALWVGRLYDAMSAGRPVGEMTSRLQEMGAISGDARDRIEQLADSGKDIKDLWPQVTKEFERYDDMMLKMSDNLANLFLGVKSFFMNNIISKWGDGLAKAITPSLERFREWRGENSGHIQAMAREFERFGESAANAVLNPINRASGPMSKWFKMLFPGVDDTTREMVLAGHVDPELLKHVEKIDNLANKPFKVRMQMVIDDIQDNYVDRWLNSAREKVPAAAEELGRTYGNFIRAGIMTVLGVQDDDSFGSIGGQAGGKFVTGFIDAIDPWDIFKRVSNKVAEINWNGLVSAAGFVTGNEEWQNQGSIAGALFANALILAALARLAPGIKLIKAMLAGALAAGGWIFSKGTRGGGTRGGPGGTGGTGTPVVTTGGNKNDKGDKPGRGGGSGGSSGTPVVTTGGSATQDASQRKAMERAQRFSTFKWYDPRTWAYKNTTVPNNASKTTTTTKPSVFRRAVDNVTTPIKTGIEKVRTPVQKGIDKALSPLKNLGNNRFLKRIPLLGTAFGALGVAAAPEGERAAAAGGLGGAIAGGAAGAALGSVVPGVGTLIGGIGGSILGGIGGEKFGGWLSNKFATPKVSAAIPFENEIYPNIQNPIGSTGPFNPQAMMAPIIQQMQAQMMASVMRFNQTIQQSAQSMQMFGMLTQRLTAMLMPSGMLLTMGIQRSAQYMQMFSVIVMQVTLAMMSSGTLLAQSIQQSATYMQMFSMITMHMTAGMMGSGMILVASIQQSAMNMQLMAQFTLMMTMGFASSGMLLVGSLMQSSLAMQMMAMVTLQTSAMTMMGGMMLMTSMTTAGTGFMMLANVTFSSAALVMGSVGATASGARNAAGSFNRLAGIANAAGSWVMSINGIQVHANSVKVALSGLARRINSVRVPNVSGGAGLSPVPYANGGMITRPHLGLVGEAGPEMIVPLSSNRRGRALSLYDQLGKKLGVGPERAYADGGLVGSFIDSSVSSNSNSEPTTNSSGATLSITGGINPTISVVVQGGDVSDPDQLAESLADRVAEKIAKLMDEVAKNMPLSANT